MEIKRRVSVTIGRGPSEPLKLAIYADDGELKQFLPGHYEVDGDLARGTLMFISSNTGPTVSYSPPLDYLETHIKHLGFPVYEPLLPIDVRAEGSPGILQFDRTSELDWMPRRAKHDPRTARVLSFLKRGESPGQVAARLLPADRDLLKQFLDGTLDPGAILPVHVQVLAARVPR